MNKNNLKGNAVLLQDNLNNASNSIYCQWYSIALHIMEFKIFKRRIFKAKRKTRTNICKISFLSKDVELVNVPSIFYDPSGNAYLSIDIEIWWSYCCLLSY